MSIKNFQDLDEKKRASIFLDGFELSKGAAKKLESHLVDHPDDIICRVKLLAFYSQRGLDKERERNLAHVLWMIYNHPDHEPFLHPLLLVVDESDAERKLIADAWMKQLNQHPSNPSVIGNAGFYLALFDVTQGLKLLEQAQELEPQNSYWTHMLGQFCFSEMTDPMVSSEAKQEFAQKVLGHSKRLSELDGGPAPGLAAEMWMPPCLKILGDTAGDTSFIAKLEAHYNQEATNKYYINAEEGLKALENDNVEAAVKLLLKEEPDFRRYWDKATRTLLHELCVRNEGEVVIKLLESMEDGPLIVERRRAAWIEEIRKGVAPTFRM